MEVAKETRTEKKDPTFRQGSHEAVWNELSTHTTKEGTEKADCTSENFLTILRRDNKFSSVRFNTLSFAPEYVKDGMRRRWRDADAAAARVYIESNYHIFSIPKYRDAFHAFCQEREYHPVQEIIKGVVWDGERRVESFLVRWMGAEDTPYSRECSRLIFAGGINRAFNPGCKYDEVIVFVGGQGSGKTTMCQWLALDSDFYSSIKTFTGQRSYEACQGTWIGEIEELLATIPNGQGGLKREETAKSFISATSDNYRRPYCELSDHHPRSCIFIGTTNRNTFLTDPTGNRRWYPVRCNGSAATLYANEAEVKAEIIQCWAEMYHAYQTGDDFARSIPKAELMKTIKAHQEDATIDDPMVGMIGEYLRDKDKVCIKEIWDKVYYPYALQPPEIKQTDSERIGNIIVHKLKWEKAKNSVRCGSYGKQRVFIRTKEAIVDCDIPEEWKQVEQASGLI